MSIHPTRPARSRTPLPLLLGIALCAVPTAATAQASGTTDASVNVTAQVYRNLTITATQDMAFGDLYPTSIASGSTYESKNATITGASAGTQPAYFTIVGHGAAEIDLSIAWTPLSKSNPADPTKMIALSSVTAQLFTDDGASTPNGAKETALTSGDNFVRTLTGTEAVETTNYLFVEASLAPGESQAPGVYSGTITVTVNYTGS